MVLSRATLAPMWQLQAFTNDLDATVVAEAERQEDIDAWGAINDYLAIHSSVWGNDSEGANDDDFGEEEGPDPEFVGAFVEAVYDSEDGSAFMGGETIGFRFVSTTGEPFIGYPN